MSEAANLDMLSAGTLIWRTVDRLLIEGRFDQCDGYLLAVADFADHLDRGFLLSALTSTYQAPRDCLPTRARVHEIAVQRFEKERGPDVAKRILEKLK